MSSRCLGASLGVSALLCLGATTPQAVIAAGKSAVNHHVVNAPSLQDVIAALHARGIDSNKYTVRTSATKRIKPISHPLILKPRTVPQLARLALPSVVRLTVLDAQGVASVQGSGVVVGTNLIATNWHVVKGAHAVTANFQNGRSEPVYGMASHDISRDLVILSANTAGVRPLLLASDTSAQVGDPVVAVGSPEGLGGSISTGIVSALRYYNGAKTIQTTAPISHGSSGGALLDIYGRVLGITSFFVSNGQNLNFAYSASHLKPLIASGNAEYVSWGLMERHPQLIAIANASPVSPAPTTISGASESVYTDKPLTGLKGVIVRISDVTLDAKKDGLDPDQIKVETELRLRKAGITVFDSLSSLGDDSGASLDILISATKNNNGVYGFNVSANLTEVVCLIRPIQCHASATTWTSGSVGTVGTSDMPVYLRQAIADQVDKFANDYLAQNPK